MKCPITLSAKRKIYEGNNFLHVFRWITFSKDMKPFFNAEKIECESLITNYKNSERTYIIVTTTHASIWRVIYTIMYLNEFAHHMQIVWSVNNCLACASDNLCFYDTAYFYKLASASQWERSHQLKNIYMNAKYRNVITFLST